MGDNQTFHQKLLEKINSFVHSIYDETGRFPKEEMFGAQSQIRRASLSVALNYVEGYARNSKAETNRFLKIAYGSLKETLYLVTFSNERNWINEDIKNILLEKGNEIARMLWSTFSRF